jgi:hypothetical protein
MQSIEYLVFFSFFCIMILDVSSIFAMLLFVSASVWQKEKNKFIIISLNVVVISLLVLRILIDYAVVFSQIGIVPGCGGIVKYSMYDCLYFSAITWTSVGYGDFTPYTYTGRFFAVMEAFNGYVMMAIVVGVFLKPISDFISQINSTRTAP